MKEALIAGSSFEDIRLSLSQGQYIQAEGLALSLKCLKFFRIYDPMVYT